MALSCFFPRVRGSFRAGTSVQTTLVRPGAVWLSESCLVDGMQQHRRPKPPAAKQPAAMRIPFSFAKSPGGLVSCPGSPCQGPGTEPQEDTLVQVPHMLTMPKCMPHARLLPTYCHFDVATPKPACVCTYAFCQPRRDTTIAHGPPSARLVKLTEGCLSLSLS